MKDDTVNIKNWTAERLETFVVSEVAVEHLHRYAIVLQLADGKKVLDIASGEGYGSNLIAGKATEVVGVDISADAVKRAGQKYKKDNLKFLEGSAAEIPCENNYFDIVVSFETIEHHDKHDEMLSDIKRVLKPGGLVIISSPDKLYYTDKRNFNNKFHVKELYENEFRELMKKNFSNTLFYYQRASFTSLLVPETGKYSFKEYSGNYDRIIQDKPFEQLYIICLASNNSLPEIGFSVFSDEEMIHTLNTIEIEKVKQTFSYRLGHIILSPAKFISNLFRSNKS